MGAMDSSADLLFKVSMDPSDGVANLEQFRGLVLQNLGGMGAAFTKWSQGVIGDAGAAGDALTRFSTFGVVGIVGLVASAAALGKELWDLGDQAAKYAKEIEDGTHKTGLSAEAMSGLRYAAKNADLEYEGLVGMLVKFQRSIVEAQDPTSKQALAFGRLGVTQAQVRAGAADLLPLLYATANGMREHADGTMKTATALTLVGRSGAGAIEFFNQGADGMKRLAAEADHLGMVLTEKDVVAAKGFRLEMIAMNAEMEGLKRSFGQAAIPWMTEMGQRLEANIETLKKAAAKGFWSFALSFYLHADDGEFDRQLAAIKERVNQQVAAANAKPGAPAVAAPEAVNKATEDFRGFTDILEQVKLKTAAAEGEEEKLAAEMAHLQMEVEKAMVSLVNLQNEGKAAPGAVDREVAAWAKLRDALPGLNAAETKKLLDKRNEAVAESGRELAALTAQQQEQTFAGQMAAWDLEIEKLREQMTKKKTLDAENQAALTALHEAGINKRQRDEEEAFKQELLGLQRELAAIVTAHFTSREKIQWTYDQDVAKYSEAEQEKRLIAVKGAKDEEAQVATIMAQFQLNRTAALTRYGTELQILHNSTGWQGVFGNQFAEGIRGNEALLREWSQSANQSLMLVKVSLEVLDEMGQKAFANFAQGMGQNIAHAFIYEQSIGKAMRAALTATLESLAGQALAYAIFSLAMGFYDLAMHDFEGASAAFTAAGIFGTVGAVAAVAGRLMAPKEAGASGGTASGGSSSSTAGSSTSSDSGASSSGPRVQVNVYGHIFGISGVQDLTDIINEAVVDRDVKLIASGVKTAGTVAR